MTGHTVSAGALAMDGPHRVCRCTRNRMCCPTRIVGKSRVLAHPSAGGRAIRRPADAGTTTHAPWRAPAGHDDT